MGQKLIKKSKKMWFRSEKIARYYLIDLANFRGELIDEKNINSKV